MFAVFSLPTILAITLGVLLFQGQVSEQLSIDLGDQPLSGVVSPAIDDEAFSDQHIAVIDKQAKSPVVCYLRELGAKSLCSRIKGDCYCFVSLQLTWSKAYDYCQTNGMTLLSIESSDEQLDIVKYVMPHIFADPLASKIGAWVSGAYIPAQNIFYWASSRIYFLYANWFVNEPNNSPSAQCVRLVPTPLGNWASLNCDQWLPFVCQD